MPHKALSLGRPVYRGYMPKDLPQHRPNNRVKPWWKVAGRPRVTVYPPREKEQWSEVAEYPPLNDITSGGFQRDFRRNWYDSIKRMPTIDEKLHEINRHCSFKMAHIRNWSAVSNGLPVVQYLTRTHVINDLPDTYKSASDGGSPGADGVSDLDVEKISRIKKTLLNQIALEKYENRKITNVFISHSIRENNYIQHIEDSLVQSLVTSLRRGLAADHNQELLDYQVDQSPALRSWWFHSGFEPPDNKPFWRSRRDADGLVNTMIQCDGRSAMNFRSDSLIEPVIDLDHELVTNTSLIQDQSYRLKAFKAIYKFKWPVALPGYWWYKENEQEDDEKTFLFQLEGKKERIFDCPHSCFLTTDSLKLRNKLFHNHALPLSDTEDALNCQAILTAFSWLNSLSMYHGYTPYQEIDYPFTCQVITTDGQNWLFNVYQLNAHTFHRDLGGPKRNNICWSSGLMKLYEEYKGDGEFIGVNEQVLAYILRFFAQQTSPTYTKSLALRPHLGVDQRPEEERKETLRLLRRTIEGRTNRWKSSEHFVPMFEHIFFRAPELRYKITHMKPPFHIRPPVPPKMFD